MGTVYEEEEVWETSDQCKRLLLGLIKRKSKRGEARLRTGNNSKPRK